LDFGLTKGTLTLEVPFRGKKEGKFLKGHLEPFKEPCGGFKVEF